MDATWVGHGVQRRDEERGGLGSLGTEVRGVDTYAIDAAGGGANHR